MIWAPWEAPTRRPNEVPLSLLLKGGQGFPIAYAPATVGARRRPTSGERLQLPDQLRSTGQQDSAIRLCRYSELDHRQARVQRRRGFSFHIHARIRDADSADSESHRRRRAELPATAFQNTTNFPGLVANNQTIANQLAVFPLRLDDTPQQYLLHPVSQPPDEMDHYLDKPQKDQRAASERILSVLQRRLESAPVVDAQPRPAV